MWKKDFLIVSFQFSFRPPSNATLRYFMYWKPNAIPIPAPFQFFWSVKVTFVCLPSSFVASNTMGSNVYFPEITFGSINSFYNVIKLPIFLTLFSCFSLSPSNTFFLNFTFYNRACWPNQNKVSEASILKVGSSKWLSSNNSPIFYSNINIIFFAKEYSNFEWRSNLLCR